MTRRGKGEGSIQKLPSGRWVAVLDLGIRNGKRVRRYFRGTSRAEVAQQLTQQLAASQQGLPIPSPKLTVGQFLAIWLERTILPAADGTWRKAPDTVAGYTNHVRNYLIPGLGHLRLVKLEPYHVDALLDDLRAKEPTERLPRLQPRAQPTGEGAPGKRLSKRSRQYCRAVLRAALQQAMRWGWLQRNVAALSAPIDVPKKRRGRKVGRAAAAGIRDAVAGDRLEALYAVALGTGMRISEALGLRWSDVDMDTGWVEVVRQLKRVEGRWLLVEKTKTEAGERTFFVPEFGLESLRAHRVRQVEEQLLAGGRWAGADWPDLIFRTAIGTPLDRRYVWRHFQELLGRAGLESLRVHDLRHGCAGLLYAEGVDLGVISALLGHSGIQITKDLYTEVLPELKRQAADRMDAALRRRSGDRARDRL